jgi:hypothetical protein
MWPTDGSTTMAAISGGFVSSTEYQLMTEVEKQHVIIVAPTFMPQT